MLAPDDVQAILSDLRNEGYAVIAVSPQDLNGLDHIHVQKCLEPVVQDALEVLQSNAYRITYRESEEDLNKSFFECKAKNMNHAIDVFTQENPGCFIEEVELK